MVCVLSVSVLHGMHDSSYKQNEDYISRKKQSMLGKGHISAFHPVTSEVTESINGTDRYICHTFIGHTVATPSSLERHLHNLTDKLSGHTYFTGHKDSEAIPLSLDTPSLERHAAIL